jgi:hypothetical protein
VPKPVALLSDSPALPRVEVVADIEGHACPCCGKALHRIGEDASERLDVVPAHFGDPNMPAGLARAWWCRRLPRAG